MRVCRRLVASLLWCAVALAVASVATAAFGQASYTAQVRGVVKDQSGAMITDATITITNDATGISTTAHSDEHGLYILTGLRPAVYTIRADRRRISPSRAKECRAAGRSADLDRLRTAPAGRDHDRGGHGSGSAAGHGERRDRHRRDERICARHSAVRPQPVWAGLSGGRGDGDHGFRSRLSSRHQLCLQRPA